MSTSDPTQHTGKENPTSPRMMAGVSRASWRVMQYLVCRREVTGLTSDK